MDPDDENGENGQRTADPQHAADGQSVHRDPPEQRAQRDGYPARVIAAGLHAVLELPPGTERAALVVGYGTPPEHSFAAALHALCLALPLSS